MFWGAPLWEVVPYKLALQSFTIVRHMLPLVVSVSFCNKRSELGIMRAVGVLRVAVVVE
jgi:hypothetical protein